MSANNGVIRVGRKGRKKFAFGEEGTPGSEPFEIDVVVAFQQWVSIDESFRENNEDRAVKVAEIPAYHGEAVKFVKDLARDPVTMAAPEISVAEALDFLARLREQYDELATFFRPKSREKQDSPDSSEAGLRFSAEE